MICDVSVSLHVVYLHDGSVVFQLFVVEVLLLPWGCFSAVGLCCYCCCCCVLMCSCDCTRFLLLAEMLISISCPETSDENELPAQVLCTVPVK